MLSYQSAGTSWQRRLFNKNTREKGWENPYIKQFYPCWKCTNKKPWIGCFTLFKPGPWFLGRLGRDRLRPGDVSGALVRPDVMGTGAYSDEIHTHSGAACSVLGKTGLFIHFPKNYYLSFCATHPSPGGAWLPGTGNSFMCFPESSPLLPVPTSNRLCIHSVHSSAMICHFELSFCLIRMPMAYNLARKSSWCFSTTTEPFISTCSIYFKFPSSSTY